MNQKNQTSEDVVFNAPKMNKLRFFKEDLIFLLALWSLNLLFLHFCSIFHMDQLATLLQILIISCCFYYVKENYFLDIQTISLYAFLYLCCIPNFFFTDMFLKFVNSCLMQVLLIYSFYQCGEDQLMGKDSDWILLDLLRAVGKVPFSVLFCMRNSHIVPLAQQESLKKIGCILLDILMSLPLLVMILPLLMSADPAFSSLIKSFHFDWGDLPYQVFLLLLSLCISLYVFLIAFGTSRFSKKELQLDTLETHCNTLTKLHCIPATILLTVECILTIVYGIFLFTSASEILAHLHASRFTFSYANFAREGFFQLCVIAFLNLCILSSISLISKKGTSNQSFKAILCIETLFLILTAISKLGMYITMYGLTSLRIYSLWFLIVLFGIFCLLLYRIFHKGATILPACRFICICFLLLNLCNPNGLIPLVNQQYHHTDSSLIN